MKKSTKWLIALLAVVLTAALAALGWYLYDTNVDRSGWREKDGITYYHDFHNKPVTGWQDIDGSRRFFAEDGALQTGWQLIDGKRYYFGDSGALAIGWLEVDGHRYRTDGAGVLLTLWQDIDGGRYYLGDDGVMVTGWQDVDGWRYFGADGVMRTLWQDIDGSRYYLGDDGIRVTGALDFPEGTCLFDEEGRLITGWHEGEAGTRYCHPDTGYLATGWTDIDGKRHCFSQEGILLTGWYREGEYDYYLLSDGTCVTGKQEIDGQIHYFTPKGIHIVLVNARNKVPDWYTPDLVEVQYGHKVDASCADALQRMLADCQAAVGYYEFNSSYRSYNDQQWILEARTQEYMATGMEYGPARANALLSVAIPGTSEHHLGLAVDILGNGAIAWLTEHCWEYGFIVRYQGEKSHITGIINEPWHYRYVGVEVARDLRASGLCLEEYVGEYIPEPEAEATPETEPQS